MPRRKIKPDPEVERAIGNRLREFRDRMGETQLGFTLFLFPTTRQQLANVESGRTPLRYRFARLIAALWGVEELDKLAGLPSATKAWPPCPDRAAGIGMHTLLSEVATTPAIERPATEKEQIARLAMARTWAGLSPEYLGDLAGYAPLGILGVESGRLLPDDQYIASVGAALNVNRHWLKTGQGPVWDFAPFPPGARPEVPTDEKFEKLKREAANRRRRVDYHLALAEQLEAQILIFEAARSCLQTSAPASPVSLAVSQGQASTPLMENDRLTLHAAKRNTCDVQPIIAQLMERIRKATQARGSKTELAKWLGTSPQSVTDWLSGRKEPSGETTLRLLAWVTAEEAKQQKNPASVTAQAESKARTETANEKASNSPSPPAS